MAAQRALMTLIGDRIAPKTLWVPLIFSAIPLMESSPPLFSHADTSALLASLQVRLAAPSL